ncbi:MAG: WD40 repeat domain-containing protein [Gemmataceae bacterium]|nr:WD40 repeat domain-containing protein [Gemmataceae bacterium]
MGSLRLVDVPGLYEKHEGEVYACAFTHDSACVLSAGWDGFLRLWDAATGTTLASLHAGPKPLSACCPSPDGLQWLSGSMEGIVSVWDGVSHQSLASIVAHTRPVSSLCFSPDGKLIASASWDRQVMLRPADQPREGRAIGSHHDIVSGCRFSPDGEFLLSWSHDGSVKLWDVAARREAATFSGHSDRVNALAVSPDGRLALSGSRDCTLRLWDLQQRCELATVNVGTEIRACLLLLDGESAAVADAAGRLFLMAVPTFEVLGQVQTPFRALCGSLSPNGMSLALGSEDGVVHLVAVEGYEETSLLVPARQTAKQTAGLLGGLFGTTRTTHTFSMTCPACQGMIEKPTLPAGPFACPRCHRRLRATNRTPALQGV